MPASLFIMLVTLLELYWMPVFPLLPVLLPEELLPLLLRLPLLLPVPVIVLFCRASSSALAFCRPVISL